MKKQQTPIVLISLLVILGGAAVILKNQPINEPAEPPRDESKITGESREGVSTKSLSDKLKQQTGDKKKNIAMLEPEDEKRLSDPAILLPDIPEYRPSPNATSATSQWFKEGTKPE